MQKNKENEKNNQQDIFDFFFKQIELNMREIGYGDTTINKNMNFLIKTFYKVLINVFCKKIFFLR